MNPGALRALEFDRIVAAVRSFALTPTGARAPRGAAARRGRRGRYEDVAGRNDRDGPVPREPAGVSAASPGGSRRGCSALLGIAGRALEPLSCWRWRVYLESIEAAAQAVRRRVGPLPAPVGHRRARGGLPRRDRRPSATRSARAARCWTTRARRCRASADRLRKQRARLRGRSSRTCAARTRRSTCRSRSSPSATAAT